LRGLEISGSSLPHARSIGAAFAASALAIHGIVPARGPRHRIVGQKRDAEVIVVGGGPAGAATAWALAKEGVDVLVLDRARFPRDKICAEYLSPEASRILADMGVLDEIER